MVLYINKIPKKITKVSIQTPINLEWLRQTNLGPGSFGGPHNEYPSNYFRRYKNKVSEQYPAVPLTEVCPSLMTYLVTTGSHFLKVHFIQLRDRAQDNTQKLCDRYVGNKLEALKWSQLSDAELVEN